MTQIWQKAVKLTAENNDTGETLVIERLNVEFDITRTLEKEPSTLMATVYNLSESSRSKLESTDRIILSLSAGYSGELHNLFLGDLRVVRHRRDGANIATDLEAGDGEKGARNWARKWFPKGTELKTIFKYLINKAQLGEGNYAEALAHAEDNGIPDTIAGGMHVRGYALDELRELANSKGLELSSQGNEV